MSRFFVQKENINLQKQIIKISGSDANHICGALRMNEGDEIDITDGYGNGYDGRILSASKNEIIISYDKQYRIQSEPDYKVTLFQGLPKKDKLELITQKAVELGAYEIVPIEMERSIVKLDNKKKDKRLARLNEISKSAAIQSGRGIIPRVENILSFKEAIKKAMELDFILVPYELSKDDKNTKEVIKQINKDARIGIFIGPEGGFSLEEIKQLESIGGKKISLGKRILRTETAGLTTLSMLVYELELA